MSVFVLAVAAPAPARRAASGAAVAAPAPAGQVAGGLAVAQPAPSGRSEAVLKHLQQTIGWYRSINALDRSGAFANDVVQRETARRMAAEALQRAFAFARAEAALLPPDPPPFPGPFLPGQRSGRSMEQVAARSKERVARLQSRLAEIDKAAAKASGSARAVFAARREQAVAELELAKQLEDSTKNMAAFIGSVGAATGGLASRIDQLERTVPEVVGAPNQRAQSRTATDAGNSPRLRPESAGIFGLASSLFTLSRARRRLGRLIERTDALIEDSRSLRTPLSNEFRAAIRRSDAIGAASASGDAQELATGRREIEDLTARVKQLQTALLPLREEGILIQTSKGNLVEWSDALDSRYSTVGSYLLMRSAGVGIVVCILLAISELWRRMTFRYARDARRRRQFLVLRRVVVGCAIALAVVLGFVSEVGSLATYAGFLTAGLAVALQGPILSVVAYFFLIGRYGLRVGDRVTISGVTGDVFEIGLVRIYIMELTGQGADLHPSGRVVAFSNAVLFQPAALFKQMPGTDYVWRTVRLVLDGECNAQVAQTKLMAAVDEVYGEYRDKIEEQHALFERSVDMKMAPPQPESRVRFTEAGLELSIHYPVELRRGAAIDERVLRALQTTIAREPELTLARAGEPRLQEAV